MYLLLFRAVDITGGVIGVVVGVVFGVGCADHITSADSVFQLGILDDFVEYLHQPMSSIVTTVRALLSSEPVGNDVRPLLRGASAL